MNKTIILASFIQPNKVDWFVNYLVKKFNLNKEKIFCYKNNDDNSKVIVTFKLNVFENEKINLKSIFPNAIIVHKKGNTLYTINALNKLIEEKFGGEKGNIDYKAYKINWSDYENKILLVKSNQLSIFNIKRIF